MKSLNACSLFQVQNDTIKLKERIMEFNEITDILDEKSYEDHIKIINNRYNFALKIKTLNLIEKGEIVFAYNENKSPIPSYLPVFLIASKKTGKPIAVCNLTLLSRVNKENGYLNINTRQLYAIAQTANVALSCFNKWNSITMNQNIAKYGAEIYSKIFTKVLDRMFAINLDPRKTDIIKFKSAEFFLRNILEKTSDNGIYSIAYQCTDRNLTSNYFIDLSKETPKDAFDDFSKFIEYLANHIDGLGELNLRNYLDNYMKIYGVSSLLSLEYFPMFYHMISSVMIGAHLNSEHVIENLVGSIAEKFCSELSIIIK